MKGLLCFSLLFTMYVGLSAQIVISEIMFDASGSEYTDEFVEIANISTTTVTLSGWRLGDGTSDDAIMDAGEGLDLLPGQYAVILDADYLAGSTSYDALIPDSALILTIDGSTLGSAGLSNSRAETITMYDPAGMIVDSCTYSIGNLHGHSDERIDLYAPNPDNWADSRTVLGTPGFRNSMARLNVDLQAGPLSVIYYEAVYISVKIYNRGLQAVNTGSIIFFHDQNRDSLLTAGEEISTLSLQALPSGDSLLADAEWSSPEPGLQNLGVYVDLPSDERPDDNLQLVETNVPYAKASLIITEIMPAPLSGSSEWVEIFNPGYEAIDLQQWQLSDEDTFDLNLITDAPCLISSQSYFLIAEDSVFLENYPSLADVSIIMSSFPSLNNTEDAVRLYDPSGGIIDQIIYSGLSSDPGISRERIRISGRSDDPDNWHACTELAGSTPGKQNSVFVDVVPSALSMNISPNPFSPDQDGYEDITLISYDLPSETATIQCHIYDVRGRLIRTLRSGSASGSSGQLIWDGMDNGDMKARIGIYIVVLEALDSRRGIVLKQKETVVVGGRL